MADITLTTKQEEGLKIALQRYKDHEPYTCIAGWAGTGKTELIKFIIKALHFSNSQVCYCSYTGKAALVLKERGCPNACTAHKLLYKTFKTRNGFIFIPRDYLEGPYQLIVVDEVSMLPQQMWDLLLSFGVYVIALGDPGQLPPIRGNNTVLNTPHIFLNEIMRQAEESEIIRLSMDIRNGKTLQKYSGNEVQIIDKTELVDGMFTWADQIICSKNQTRHEYNKFMRKTLLGVEDSMPIPGDKLICLKNNWKKSTKEGDCLVNGMIGYADSIQIDDTDNMYIDFIPEYYSKEDIDKKGSSIYFKDLWIDKKLLLTGQETEPNYRTRNWQWQKMPEQFDYGYAITCWKAQGSEYHKILIIEENFPFNAEEHKKWLYTACTRAIDKLVLVRM